MTKKKTTFSIKWKYSGAIRNETLGRNMYSKAITALGEILSNSLDAGSLLTEIELSINDLGALESIVIKDKGIGISRERMEKTFADVGNKYKQEKPLNPLERRNIGRKGIGRFAVYRLGNISQWETTSREGEGFIKYNFKLEESQGDAPPKVTPTAIEGDAETGTTITIRNIDESSIDRVFQDDDKLRLAIFSQFPVYLFQYPDVVIKVNGTPIAPDDYIFSRRKEDISFIYDGNDYAAEVTHVFWNPGVKIEKDTVLVVSSAGRIIFEESILVGNTDKKYAAFVESPIIDDLVSSNREGIQGFDPVYEELKSNVLDSCRKYIQQASAQQSISFIERARLREYYPYTSVKTMPEHVSQMVYDQFLDTLNAEVNLENATHKQQRVIFKLLKRALESHDIITILDEVSSLTDEDAKKFRELLEQVTLSSVIQVSSMLADRLSFLDNLHKLVYGKNIAKHVKERKQLHKLIEPHAWLFGEQYNLSSSDQSFRTIVANHRAMAGLQELSKEEINQISDVGKIPDLFLVSRKFENFEGKYHNLIVEMKAPDIPIDRKAVQQAEDYALIIAESPEFDTNKTEWEIFVVSTKIASKIQGRLQVSKDNRPGCLVDRPDYRIFARTWAELNDERRAELNFICETLKKKTEGMEELDYFRKKFNHLLPPELKPENDLEIAEDSNNSRKKKTH